MTIRWRWPPLNGDAFFVMAGLCLLALPMCAGLPHRECEIDRPD
jgi:hypothetical protein